MKLHRRHTEEAIHRGRGETIHQKQEEAVLPNTHNTHLSGEGSLLREAIH